MEALEIIRKFYPQDNDLRRLLIHHSLQVTSRALKVVDAGHVGPVDRAFVERAAMLHDLGIFLTDAPGIHCHGSAPYILHGILGGKLLRQLGLEREACVCERHTGTGLTLSEFARRGVKVPDGIYAPQSLEEQIICYADKFYSKSHPDRERTVEQAAKSLTKYGETGVKKFLAWAWKFETYRVAAEPGG